MSAIPARAEPDWLILREPADAQARPRHLVSLLRPRLPEDGPLIVHDFGSGTGSMRRWLAPQLRGPQIWHEYDRDGELLQREVGASGNIVSVEHHHGDFSDLDDLGPASLVTCSALLDVLTAASLDALIRLASQANVPCLLTLSVVGRTELSPAHELDHEIQQAFNEHQRRDTSIGRLLGPDAVHEAARRFEARGFTVLTQPSPWRLEPGELLDAWLEGWQAAAREQDPRLGVRPPAQRATVHHLDLLAYPP